MDSKLQARGSEVQQALFRSNERKANAKNNIAEAPSATIPGASSNYYTQVNDRRKKIDVESISAIECKMKLKVDIIFYTLRAQTKLRDIEFNPLNSYLNSCYLGMLIN